MRAAILTCPLPLWGHFGLRRPSAGGVVACLFPWAGGAGFFLSHSEPADNESLPMAEVP
jgi:hypothetical protein